MKYHNPHLENLRRNPLQLILWMAGYYRDPFEVKASDDYRFPIQLETYNDALPWAQWVNHSTYLIQVQGRHLLTDPIWSRRCSPVSFAGPKRRHPPGLAFEQLPPIDYVLISHDHYDHLDRPTVQALHRAHPQILWVVPTGVRAWFLRLGIKRVTELNWGEEFYLESAMKVTSVPAQHFSGRFKMNSTLWCGYVLEALEASKTLYFAGDTGYNSKDFKAIGEKWQSIDLSLIPIGAYSPRRLMSPVHIEPRDAVKIHSEIGSRFSLAMHWKTFPLSDEPMQQPPMDLYHALQEANVEPRSFLALEPGQKVNW